MLQPAPSAPRGCAADTALFLDFDGTLVDIAPRPDDVQAEPGLVDALDRLRQRLGGALAIVSGRAIAVLDKHLSPYRFDAAGLHGVERRIAGRLSVARPDGHPRLRVAVGRLQERFGREPGLVVEDKGFSVALHWRLAPDRAEEMRAAAEETVEALGGGYRVQWGKAVAEIVPAASGKGHAIEAFLAEPPYRGRRPVFVGDDLTDEDGFRAVHAHGGTSIRIGPGESIAQERFETPADLRRRLFAWADGTTMGLDLSGAAPSP